MMQENNEFGKPSQQEKVVIVHNEVQETVEARRIEMFIQYVREASSVADALNFIPSIMQRDQLVKLLPILSVEHPTEAERVKKDIETIDVEGIKGMWVPVLERIRDAPDASRAKNELGSFANEIKTFDFVVIRPSGMLDNQ